MIDVAKSLVELLDGIESSPDTYFSLLGFKSRVSDGSVAVSERSLRDKTGAASAVQLKVSKFIHDNTIGGKTATAMASELFDMVALQGGAVDADAERVVREAIRLTLPSLAGVRSTGSGWISKTSTKDVIGVKDDAQSPASVIEIYYPTLTPSTRHASTVDVFMNVIPTLEMSKCVPFVSVEVRRKSDGGASDDQMITLERHLGINRSEGASVESAESGMELFTLPQSLFSDSSSLGHVLDRYRPFVTLKEIKLSVVPTTGLMSFKAGSMSLTLHDRSRLSEIADFVQPNMYKGIEIVLTYGWSHPESDEKTGLIGDNKWANFLDSLRVTEVYGIKNSSYSFSDSGEVEIGLSLYMLGNTDMQLVRVSEGNDVDDAKALASVMADVGKIVGDITGVTSRMRDVSPIQFINTVTDTNAALSVSGGTLRDIKKFMGRKHASQDLSVLSALLKQLYGDIRSSKKKVAKKSSKQSKNSDPLSSYEKLVQGAAGKARVTLAQSVNAKLDHLVSELDVDPFLVTTDVVGHSTHVSLASIMLSFMANPIAGSGKYSDVQLVFYPFNSRAGLMHDHGIASFPIRRDVFLQEFVAAFTSNVAPTVAQFTQFLSDIFVQNPAHESWGLSDLYESHRDGDRKVWKPKKSLGDNFFDSQYDRLSKIYGGQGEIAFKMPTLTIFNETVPNENHSLGPILRIHVFDAAQSAYGFVSSMLGAVRRESLGALSINASSVVSEQILKSQPPPSQNNSKFLKKSSKKKKKLGGAKAEKIPDVVRVNHRAEFSRLLKDAIDSHVIESVDSSAADTKKTGASSGKYYRILGGSDAVKKFVSSAMPTVTFGTETSMLHGASLTSVQEPGLSTVMMQRQGAQGSGSPQGVKDRGMPFEIVPAQLNMSVFGFPFFAFGQQIFVDFGTGTTADNIYAVTGIEHDITQGEFKTTLTMRQIDSYGTFRSLTDIVKSASEIVDAAQRAR